MRFVLFAAVATTLAGCVAAVSTPARADLAAAPGATVAAAPGTAAGAPANVAAAPAASTSLAAAPAGGDPGVALLEIFTSEGCSSTPPAEAAVNQLEADARAAGRPLYALAWHVTYWDQLGWKDTFAQTSHTDYQWAYARALAHTQIYTPQVVLGGQGDLPWGDGGAARAAINKALATPATARVTLSWADAGGWKAKYAVSGAAPGARLTLALAERGLVVDVARGENAGRKLAHAPVVRAVAIVDATTGEASLSAPAGLDRSRTELIGFVQGANLAVTGAARLEAALPGGL